MSLATTCVNGVCSCVLPLDRNDFRPLALRHRSLAFVSALLIAVKVVTVMAIAVTPTTAELSTITVARVVQLTNAERQKAGQSVLTVNSKLAAAAQKKGEDMLAHDYFAHISPSGVTPWFWMQQQNYTYQVAGENLAIDFVEVEDVVAAWMASPSHHDNLLHSAYTETGVAVVTGEFQGGTSTIVVHMFGLPTGATVTTTSPTPVPATTKQSPTPTAIPTPVPTPSPTPLPAPVRDTTPPRTPRIALEADHGTVVSTTLLLSIEADPGSALVIKGNNTNLATLIAGDFTAELDVSALPDGDVVITAQARDAAGNISSVSNSLVVQKDSVGPSFDRSLAMFVVSPQTDVPTVAALINNADAAEVTVNQSDTETTFAAAEPIVLPIVAGETNVHLHDKLGNRGSPITLALLPHYTAEADDSLTTPPARLNQVSRWLIGLVLVLLVGLLLIAFFVRLSIQRPAMLAHTSAVVVLAGLLFLL